MSTLKKPLRALATTLLTLMAIITAMLSGVVANADTAVAADEVQRGQLVIYKCDAQTGLAYSQGGANLAGAKFTVENTSSKNIDYRWSSKLNQTDYHTTTVQAGGTFTIVVKAYDASGVELTDDAGNLLSGKSWSNVSYYAAKTRADALPVGTYHVRETGAGTGYGIASNTTYLSSVFATLSNNATLAKMGTTGYDFSINKESDVVTFGSKSTVADRNWQSAQGLYSTSLITGATGPTTYNIPVRGEIHVLKQDYDFQKYYGQGLGAQGNATIEGATFEIINLNSFAVTVWGEYDETLKHGTPLREDANGDGWYEPGEVVATIKTGASGEATTYADALPVGWYKVVEVGAPDGYTKTTQALPVSITDDDTNSGPTTKVQNQIKRGGAAFYKADADSQSSDPQGDASLAGATITITNESDNDVYIYEQDTDKADGDSHVGRYSKGQVVATIQTDATGYAYIYGLPVGTYKATETKASNGYINNDTWEVTFDITGTQGSTEGKYIEVTPTDDTPLYQTIIRGDIKGAKVDGDTHLHEALGGATLEGATITVTNASENEVYVYCDSDGKPYASDKTDGDKTDGDKTDGDKTDGDKTDGDKTDGDKTDGDKTDKVEQQKRKVVAGKVVATLTTDANGYFEIKDLPAGTYKLTEKSAPTGYMLDTTWVQYVKITEDGKVYDLTEYDANNYVQTPTGNNKKYSALADEVIREDILFQKFDENSKPMSNVAFKLTNKKTGEWHILVTDEDGMLDTSAYMADDATDTTQTQWRMHTYNTNKSDAAYSNGLITSSALTYDQGYWFYGVANDATKKSTVNNKRSALPYGEYTLTELRCDANIGYDLIERDVTINRANGDLEDLGTLDNKVWAENTKPVYSTGIQATKSADKADNTQVNAGDEITYTISYNNTLISDVYAQIRDYIPSGTEFVSATAGGVFVSAEDSANGYAYVEWVSDSLAPGASGDVTFTVRVVDNPCPLIVNQALYEGLSEQITAGDTTNSEPNGATNIIRHTTDTSKCGYSIKAEKTSSPVSGTTVSAGDKIKYTITLTNTGDSASPNMGVSDVIPYGTSVATTDDAGTTKLAIDDNGYMVGDTLVGWNVGSITAGETRTVSYTVDVTDKAVTLLQNQATFGVAHGKVTGSFDNSTNVVEHKVVREPKVSITKTSDAGEHTSRGSIITYTLNIVNNGAGNAENVNVYDAIGSGTHYVADSMSTEYGAMSASSERPYVSWTIPTLAHDGGSVSVSYQVRVDDTATVGDIVNNTASIGGTAPVVTNDNTKNTKIATDVQNANNTDPISNMSDTSISNTVTCEIIDPCKDVEVIKSSDPADGSYVKAGDELTYTITYTNKSDVTVNGFGVRDVLDSNVTLVDSSITLTDPNGTSASPKPKDTTTNTVTPNTQTEDSVVWTEVTTVNSVDTNAVYDVVVADKTCQSVDNWSEIAKWLENAKSGESITFVVSNSAWYDMQWKATVIDGGKVVLCCHVLVDSKENSANYASTDRMWANYDSENRAVYAVQSKLAPGESATITFKVTVNSDVADNTAIKNTATYGDGVYGQPTGDLPNKSNETTVYTGEPKLVGIKSVDTTYAKRGDVVTYTVSVTNEGNAVAHNVGLYDEFADNGLTGLTYVEGSYVVTGSDAADVCLNYSQALTLQSKVFRAYTNTLEPGATVAMKFSMTLEDVYEHDVISNTAQFDKDVDSGDFSRPDNDTNTVQTKIDDPELSIFKSVDVGDAAVCAGDTLTYTIDVKNVSGVDTDKAAVYDVVPPNTTLDTSSLSEGLSYENGALYAYNQSVKAGETKHYSFAVKVNNDVVASNTVSNTATCGIVENKPTSPLTITSNTVSNVVAAPDITVVKSQDKTDGGLVTGSETITYTITATNIGKKTASGVGIFDEIPANTSYVDGSLKVAGGVGNEVTYTDSAVVVGDSSAGYTGAVSAFASTLEPNATMTLTYSVTVDLGYVGGIINQATYDWNLTKAPVSELPRLTNDVDVSSVLPKLEIYKTQNPASGSYLSGGDVLTYTVYVKNTGNVTAKNVGIYDEAPEHTTYVENSLEGTGTCSVGEDGLLTVLAGDVAPNQTVSLTFKAEIDLGYVGTIHNRGLWVSPATTPTVKDLGTSEDATTNTLVPASIFRPLSFLTSTMNVNIPDGASSGWSNDTANVNSNTNSNTNSNANSNANSNTNSNINSNANSNANNNTNSNANNNTNSNTNSNVNNDTDDQTNSPSTGSNTSYNHDVPNSGTTTSTDKVIVAPDNTKGDGSNEVVASVVAPTVHFTKTQNPPDGSYVYTGDVITYTLTVENAGLTNANYLVIEDEIADGLVLDESSIVANGLTAKVENNKIIATGNVAAGVSATITYSATVNTQVGSDLVNIAKIAQDKDGSIDEGDPYTKSNEVVVHCVDSEFMLIKSANVEDGSNVAQGDEVEFNLDLVNSYSENKSAIVTDVLDENFELVDGSVSFNNEDLVDSYAYDKTTRTLIVNTKEMTPQQHLVITYKTLVGSDVENGTTVKNIAAWQDSTDETINGKSNTIAYTVAPSSVVVTKTVADGSTSGTYDVGDTVTYTIKVANTADKASTVKLYDVLPDDVTYKQSSCTNANATLAYTNGTLTYTATLDAGEIDTITYTVTINSDAYGKTIVNKVSYNVDGKDINDNPEVSIKTGTPKLNITKSVDKTTANIGDELTYTIYVSNTGDARAVNVKLSDVIPDGVEYIVDSGKSELGSGSVQGLTYSGSATITDGTATVDIAEIDAGMSAKALEFKVKATSAGDVKNTAYIIDANNNKQASNEVVTTVASVDTPTTVSTTQTTPTTKSASELGKTGQDLTIFLLIGVGIAFIITGGVILIRKRLN